MYGVLIERRSLILFYLAVVSTSSLCMNYDESSIHAVIKCPAGSNIIFENGARKFIPGRHSITHKQSLAHRKRLLLDAIRQDNVVICNALINRIQVIKGIPCLHSAVVHNATKVVDYLIKEKKFPIDVCDSKKNQTALWFALEQTHCIDQLLQLGINVNHQDIFGNTALHAAVLLKSLAGIDMLCRHTGSNLLLKNNQKETPLELAAKLAKNDNSAIAVYTYLKEKMLENSNTLHAAIKKRNYGLLRALICSQKDEEQKISFLTRDQGLTPLGFAHALSSKDKRQGLAEIKKILREPTKKEVWAIEQAQCIICKMNVQELDELEQELKSLIRRDVTSCCTHPLCSECMQTYDNYERCVLCHSGNK